MLNHSQKLLMRALSACRDAEIAEEVYTEVNLAQPDRRNFQSGLGLRVNVEGRLGFMWSEGQYQDAELISLAVREANSGQRGSFSQKGLSAPSPSGPTSAANRQLEHSLTQLQAFIQGLDFLLPSLLPERKFSLSARLLQHTLKLTTRNGERWASRILHLVTLTSTQGLPVSGSLYSTSAPSDPSALLCQLAWRSAHSQEVAWPEDELLPAVFTAEAAGKLLEDFALDSLTLGSPLNLQIPKDEAWLHPTLTLSDDHQLVGGFGSVPFDGEGLTRQPVTLLKEGRLLNSLADIATAREYQTPPLGLAVRPWGQAPRPGYSNLRLAPGSQALSELCQMVDYGVLLDRLTPLPPSWNRPGYFCRRAETAFLLQKGRPVCRLPQFIVSAPYQSLLGEELLGLGYETRLCGRTLCPPLAVKRLALEEADLEPSETWSDYPNLWW